MQKVLIARWQTPNGKRFLDIFRHQWGYAYTGDGSSGSLRDCQTDAEAIAKAQDGRFSPVAMFLFAAKRGQRAEVPNA